MFDCTLPEIGLTSLTPLLATQAHKDIDAIFTSAGLATHTARALIVWEHSLRTRPVVEVRPGAVPIAVEARRVGEAPLGLPQVLQHALPGPHVGPRRRGGHIVGQRAVLRRLPVTPAASSTMHLSQSHA